MPLSYLYRVLRTTGIAFGIGAGVLSTAFGLSRLEILRRQSQRQAQMSFLAMFQQEYAELQVTMFESLEAKKPYFPQSSSDKARLEGYVAFVEQLQKTLNTNAWYLGASSLDESWVFEEYGHGINTLVRTPTVHGDFLCRNPNGWTDFLAIAKRSIEYAEEHDRKKQGHDEAKAFLMQLSHGNCNCDNFV